VKKKATAKKKSDAPKAKMASAKHSVPQLPSAPRIRRWLDDPKPVATAKGKKISGPKAPATVASRMQNSWLDEIKAAQKGNKSPIRVTYTIQ
jgi:hypothetical protein